MGINILGHQTTLRERIEFRGVGVHSGKPVTMILSPAGANTGIVFSVTCPNTGKSRDIAANADSIGATELCTILGDPRGLHAATVEHLLAALRAMNVDNVIVEMESGEAPVLDGCARQYVDAIHASGLTSLSALRAYIRVLKPVRAELGTAWGELAPYAGTRYDVEIDFTCEAIGRQRYAVDLSAQKFADEICRARTFGFLKDVEKLWAAGFALGSSLENSIVIGEGNAVINPDGLRYPDEFVRHKMLDAIGDLALIGAPILGCFRSYRGGHKLNSMVVKALLSDKSAFEFVGAPVSRAKVRHAELVTVGAPAYAPALA